MVDVDFVRHACVECDRCGTQRTLELAESKGWLLEEKDLCERCREQPKSNRKKRGKNGNA
jgi:hypothetical protein